MKNIVDFDGKHMLVIGASSGIGLTTALTLNRLGANVDIMSRNEEALNRVIQLLESGNNACYKLDVTDYDSIGKVISNAVELKGPYDGFVYAAGVALNCPILQLTKEKMQWVFNTNFFGFIESVRQISRKNRFNPGMRIVGVSSISSIKGGFSQTAYSGSKAAMDGAVRSLAVELAKKDICINTVAPSMINTRMYQDYLKDYGTDGIQFKILQKRQIRGIGEPQDVANLIAFLLSPAARMLTGISMPVDGGYRT